MHTPFGKMNNYAFGVNKWQIFSQAIKANMFLSLTGMVLRKFAFNKSNDV